jgi:hypothetical protein
LVNFIGRQDSDWVGPEVNFGGLRPVPIPGITDVPIHHIKRPAFALFFFVRASVANKRNSTAEVRGFGDQCVCVRCPGLLAVFIKTDDWLRF